MANYELNIHDYWRIVIKRRWVIIMTAVAVIGSVAVFTNLQMPLYQATATVKMEPSLAIPGVSTNDQAAWDPYTIINTEVKIIKSALVADRAARKLGLLPDGISDEQKATLIGSIQSKISAERVGDTNLVNISAASSDPAETARLANTAAEVYIEKGIQDRNRRARELREFIQSQLSEAETKLNKAEDTLRSYTERSGAKGVGGYLSQRLIDLQSRRSELLKKYTDQHPEVQRLKQQIASLEGQMKELPAEELEYARLTREVNINEELYTLLAKRYKEAQITEADRVQSAFIVTPAREPANPVKPNRALNLSVGVFFGLFLGFVMALVLENLDTSIGTIEDVEKYLSLPVVGIIPRIVPEEKHRKLSVNAGKDPRLIAARAKLIVFHSLQSPFVEAYHTLRANLKLTAFKDGGSRGKIISFTSASISEGKTITASNFALAAAQSGTKTLLLEMDLRRPSIHRLFGINRDPGISSCLIGSKQWTEVVRGTSDFVMGELGMEEMMHAPGIENLRVITSGPLPPNPVDLFNSTGLSRIFEEMSRQYELVVVDCPPVLMFADPLIIGTCANGTVIVYQVGKMARSALKRAKDQLVNVNVPVLGVVLNDLTASGMEPGYGYYYSYKYYAPKDQQNKAR